MMFLDEHSVSFWQKLVFSSVMLIAILACMFSMLPNLSLSTAPFPSTGDGMRRILIMALLLVYFLRSQVTAWVFQKRKWTWLETAIVSIAMSLGFYAFTYFGESNYQPIGMIEMIGVVLYVTGSYINTRSEYDRYNWKEKKENKGHLYTKGLFKYSMHINYFGEIVLFIGFAMATHPIIAFIIPLVMLLNFILNIIPSLDSHLEKKYGLEFSEYARRTKRFIPLIY